MLDRSLIGRESEPVVHEVEKGAIRRFAEALGDPNPIYTDEAAARAAGYPVARRAADVRRRRSPRTSASATRSTSAPASSSTASSRSSTRRPIVAGDRITVRSKVADVQERAGASGPMDVIVIEDEGRDEKSELVFRTRAMLILRRG